MSTYLHVLTVVHVIISLVAIVSGFVVVAGWVRGRSPRAWTPLFFWMTVATSVTGFFFPFAGFTPAFGFGVISLIVLWIAFIAPGKGWRKTYLISALFALYLNTFVLIVQSFLKIPALKAIAPTQAEPPFAIAQTLLLVLFIVLGIGSVRRFRFA